MNRATANRALDQLDAAERDYQTLLSAGSSSYRTKVLFGLPRFTSARKTARRA